ncbi:hypothetical protein EV643_1425 [Kribbella sp. VKM Ac-2527]|uniref:Uncharacterized protein n=1 Tax=Kribbella caucasensis TaxID=2512215 RepID=A0A4R6J6L2_9ACTN|nr:hypothetical protein [Kribbella sp. VKM Ac-2527]TDO29996.1 hypothetical protein EV643_1425 [Kribbella sp. VKM Ac-2527]
MSTITSSSHRLDVLHPLLAAATGAVIFGLTMTAGEVFDLNTDSAGGPATTTGEIALYAGIVVAAGVIAVWLGLRARAGSPRRLATTALGLGIAAAATYIAFWSGWPHVFGAVAVVLASEHRRRVGSFSATTAIALGLGALALVAAAITCVLG